MIKLRRIFRLLVPLSAVFLFLLAVATTISGTYSFRMQHVFLWEYGWNEPPAWNRYAFWIAAGRGRIWWQIVNQHEFPTSSSGPLRTFQFRSYPNGGDIALYPSTSHWTSRFGFDFSDRNGDFGQRIAEGIVPHWFIAALLAIFPLFYAVKKFRRRRRNISEFACPKCSYDLRAHRPGDKCPECGSIILAAAT